MKRLSMRILSVLSLALLVGSVVIWVRSVRLSDQLAYRNDRGARLLMTVPHGLCFQALDVPGSGALAVMASSLAFPERGWSVRSLPWGPTIATSHVSTGGRGELSISVTISADNDWSVPVNSALGFGWETQPRPLVVVVPF